MPISDFNYVIIINARGIFFTPVAKGDIVFTKVTKDGLGIDTK